MPIGLALWTLIALMPLACGGCGLLLIPQLEALPHPVRDLRIVNDNGAPASDADVQFSIYSLTTDSAAYTVGADYTGARSRGVGSKVGELAVQRVGDGRFRFGGRLMLGIWQFWWPLPWSRTWTTYYGHAAAVTVRVPRHPPETLTYCPVTSAEMLAEVDVYAGGPTVPDHWTLARDGALTLHLGPAMSTQPVRNR